MGNDDNARRKKTKRGLSDPINKHIAYRDSVFISVGNSVDGADRKRHSSYINKPLLRKHRRDYIVN
jgi:hypothetical protein